MRLVRIVSEDPQGHFESIFDTDIRVEKGQQIALQSASFSEQINTISIDSSNNDLDFQFKGGTSISILLDEVDYDNSNKEDLLTDITNKLNAGLVFSAGKAMGLNFLAHIDPTSDRVEIGYQRSDFINANTRVTRNQSAYNVIGGQATIEPLTNKLQSTIGDSTDDRAKYYAEIPWAFNGGGMMWRVQVCNFVDNGDATENNGFEVGLSNISPNDPTNGWASKTTMSNADKSYAVKYRRAGDQIQFTSTPASGYQASGFTPNKYDNSASDDNDIVEFHISENRLKAVRYKVVGGVSSTDEIFNIEHPGVELYPFLILRGGVNSVKVRGAVHTINPYATLPTPHTLTNDDNHPDHAVMVGTAPSFNGGNGLTDNILTLSSALQQFFGFDANVTFQQGGPNFFFVADRIFLATLSNVSFIIELNSIQIESYNSANGQRQNIVGVVPQQVQGIAGLVEYEPNNLYFINILENALVRNFRARILRIDGSRVRLSGLSVLTFLIKDKGE